HTNYMYVGGLFDTNPGGTTGQRNIAMGLANWGKMIPAVKVSDRELSQRVLGADEVYRHPSGVYRINHQVRGGSASNPRPEFQNIVFGDGHVEGKGRASYARSDWTLYHSVVYWGGGPWFYWGRSELGAAPVP